MSVLVPVTLPAPAELLDHLTQSLDVGHLEPHQSIGVARPW